MKTGIIFDMDGTLWDSAQQIADSWNEVIKKYDDINTQLTATKIKNVMGKIMDEIAEILFDEVSKERQLELLKECCIKENEYLREHGAIVYEGVETVFKKLREKYELFIVSNCQSGYIEAFLDYYKYGKYIKDIECFGDTGCLKADNIRLIIERNKLDKAIYVGDTQGDCDSALAAGAEFICAEYGFGNVANDVPRINSFIQLLDNV